MKIVPTAWVPLIFSLFVVGVGAPTASAALTVAPYFTNNMVLQRGMEVPVWGTATIGAAVTVSFNGNIRSTSFTVSTDYPMKGKERIPPFAIRNLQFLTLHSVTLPTANDW